MKPLNQIPKLQTLPENVEPLSRNRDPNMTQNEYVYAICCRPEAAGDVISSGTLKTIEGCAVNTSKYQALPLRRIGNDCCTAKICLIN